MADILDSVVVQKSPAEMPVIKAYSKDFIKDSKFNQACQEKLVRAMINMQALTPYYATILQAIKRVPAPGLGTFAVTEDCMYYDMQFVARLRVPELTFVLIHEILHIAMQCSVRCRGRNHKLWNIANDLYVNTIICKDFGCRFGGPAVTVSPHGKKAAIKTPPFGIYMETIRKRIDLRADTPETIYAQMIKENPSAQKPEIEEDSSEGGQGNSNQNKDSSESGQGNSVQNKDSSESGQGNSNQNGLIEVDITFKGKQIRGTILKDIMSNRETKTKENVESNLEDSRKTLQRIVTKIKLEEEELGHPLEKTAGEGVGLVERYIEVGLSAGVDWKVLLRNMCKGKPKKTFTLAQPNRDYMNVGIILADRHPIGKPTQISHVKFAVDVSGSVLQQELDTILSEINQIFSYFKVDGELIYWSTAVGNAGMFSSLKELLKIEPISDGGTDVRCVFEYLSGQTEVNMKYEQDKVRDMKGIFILTDGNFWHNYDEFAAAFGKKVIWLLTGQKGNPILFDPPFGKVISIDIDT